MKLNGDFSDMSLSLCEKGHFAPEVKKHICSVY